MLEWVSVLYGKYTLQLFLNGIPFLIFVFSSSLFSLPLQKRGRLWQRALFGTLLYIAIFTGIAVLRTDYDSFAVRNTVRVALYFLILPYLMVAIKESFSRIMLCWCGAVAATECASKSFTLLLNLLGKNDLETNSLFADSNMGRDILIQYAITFAICFLLYWIFGRKDATAHDRISARSITVLSFASTTVLAVASCLIREFETESLILYRINTVLLVGIGLLILFFRSGILTQNQYRSELNLMENVITQERKQFDSIKDNMDFINMKCHDLKHQLANFEGRLSSEEIASLSRTIEIYDQTPHTGNDTLDVVLYEKSLICQEKGISLSCLADGEALSFMGRTHLYSLMNNALSNAIEAAGQVSDPERRVVSFTTEKKEGVLIEVTNYFAVQPEVKDGILATTKKDKAHHGLGMRSMRYVAGLYGGTVTYTVEEDIFLLSIRFPKDAKLKKEGVA